MELTKMWTLSESAGMGWEMWGHGQEMCLQQAHQARSQAASLQGSEQHCNIVT